jgi:hypothetical protein
MYEEAVDAPSAGWRAAIEGELVLAKDTALRSRIRKSLKILTLEGEKAPEILAAEALSGPPARLADLSGRAVLLFFRANKDASPAEENTHVPKVFTETFPGLEGVSVPVDTETMVRYSASATPTVTLVDRKSRVRLNAPTRASEAELARPIESVLSE